MFNRVTLIGHLGADPEIKSLHSGGAVANFSMATSESWKDKQTGERRSKTEWHRIVVYNEGLVKIAEQYLHKGSKVYVEGQLQTRKWEKDGVERYITEIVMSNFNGKIMMLDSKDEERTQGKGKNKAKASKPDYNDEIPF